jgi:hypothetical protein
MDPPGVIGEPVQIGSVRRTISRRPAPYGHFRPFAPATLFGWGW